MTIFCASQISLLKRWGNFLKNSEFFISNNQNELFTFLQAYDKHVVIIIENQIFQQEFESFLTTLTTHYKNVQTCVLSNTPNLKEGIAYLEIGVKGYGNSYMSFDSFTNLLTTLEDGLWWFYPDFVENFFPEIKNNSITTSPIYIKNLEHLAIIRSENNEKIAEVGDLIQEHETLVLPYEDSKVTLNINDNTIEISGINTVLYEQSIFSKQEIKKISPLNKDLIKHIFDTIGTKAFFLENSKQDSVKNFLEHEKLYFTGILSEYDIFLSKKEEGYMIVNDKVKNRDESVLIHLKKIKILIFKDKNHII